MNSAEQKVMQYLYEAHAGEDALTRVLESQIAAAPTGSLRTLLEAHLDQTRAHAARLGEQLDATEGSDRLMVLVGFWEDAIARAVGIATVPSGLLRGLTQSEKALEIAKDVCAAEAREIATYSAIEGLARAADDSITADLARSILAEESAMLDAVLGEISALSQLVYEDRDDSASGFDLTATSAAHAVRDARAAAKGAVDDTTRAAKRAVAHSRRVPGFASVESQLRGLLASGHDLAVAGYDELSLEEIIARLTELTQSELATIQAYERRNHKRRAILDQVDALRIAEPWAGYDDLTAAQIRRQLRDEHYEHAARVRDYEPAHKDRSSVLTAATRAHHTT